MRHVGIPGRQSQSLAGFTDSQDQVPAVGVAGEPGNFSRKVAPRFGGLVSQEDRSRSLPHDEAITANVEGTGRLLWCIVEIGGTGEEVVEDGHRGGVVFVGPSAKHGILHAVPDGLVPELD